MEGERDSRKREEAEKYEKSREVHLFLKCLKEEEEEKEAVVEEVAAGGRRGI